MNNLDAASTIKVTRDEDALVLHWENGEAAAFPHHWLKENAPENRHPVTGAKLASYLDGNDELSPWSVYIEYDETLVISWAGLREVSRFPLDELRASTEFIDSAELALAAD